MTKRAGTWIRMQLNIYIVEDVHSILAETYEHIDWTYTYQIENRHTTRFGMWLKHVRTTQDSNGWTSFDLGPLKASWLRQENTGKVRKKSVPVTLSTARPRMSKRKVLRVIWRILIDVCADRWGNSWNSWMGRWCLLAQYIDDKLCLQINDMWYSAPVSWGLWQKNDVKEGTPKWIQMVGCTVPPSERVQVYPAVLAGCPQKVRATAAWLASRTASPLKVLLDRIDRRGMREHEAGNSGALRFRV